MGATVLEYAGGPFQARLSDLVGSGGLSLGCTEQKLHYHGRTGCELGQKEIVCSILAVQWSGKLNGGSVLKCREGSDFD